MLYTLLTKDDIDAIELILRDHLINYEVSANEELIQAQDARAKKILNRHGEDRRTDALYNLVIEKEEFGKIPLEAQVKLERYNIYPEMNPETMDTHYSDEISVQVPPKISPESSKIFYIVGFIVVFYVGLLWVDKYIIEIFPSNSQYNFEDTKRVFPKQP